MSGSVGLVGAVRLTLRVVVRQLLTRGRALALILLGAFLALLAFAVGSSDTVEDPIEDGVRLLDLAGFTLVVPIVALVFAAASLGDLREDRTLVYLWLRPIGRAPVVIGAWLGSIIISLPFTLPALVLSGLLLDAGSDVIVAAAVATAVGVVAYAAVFVLLGLLVRNAVIWGVGYVLMWEGLIAQFGTATARVAIRGYTRSILASITDVDLDLGELSLASGIAGALIITVIALVVAVVRLGAMEID